MNLSLLIFINSIIFEFKIKVIRTTLIDFQYNLAK